MELYLAGLGGVLSGGACRVCDPRKAKRCKDLELYLAGRVGSLDSYVETSCDWQLFRGANILQSFYYCNEFTEKAVIPHCKNFMLDSGAFTFLTSHKGKVDWNEYIQNYVDFINRNDVDLFFELDIDPIVGYDKVKEIRRFLEAETGKKPIPVWHKSRRKEDYLQMCEEYDYVALGGIVTKEITQKEYKIFPWFISEAHKRKAKIHALGFTNLKGLTQYPFDSVDSTAWVSGNRFGSVYQFNGETMIKYNKKEGQRLASAQDTAIHNYTEWRKFQEYARKYL